MRRPAAATLLIWLAAPAGAQTLARQRAVVDSLARELTRAEAALEALGRATSGERDTIRVGALTVVAPMERAALAAAAVPEAWTSLTAHLGDAAQGLARDTFELRLTRPGVPVFRTDWRVLSILDNATPEAVSSRLLQLAMQALLGQRQACRPAPIGEPRRAGPRGEAYSPACDPSSSAADSLRAWLGPGIPFALPPRELHERTYLALVTSLSVAAERCYLGDLEWCREAVGIAFTDDPVRRWYDAGGRRALVAGRSVRLAAWTAELYDQCTRDGSDVACTMLLDALPEGMVRQVFPPLPPDARQLLWITALARGGSRAAERLQVTPGSIQERLVAAAGEPIDSLLSAWWAAVVAAAPPAPVVAPRARWMALAWVVVFTSLAIGLRRWR